MKWRPTKHDCEMIRRYAEEEATGPVRKIEMGIRFNINDRNIIPNFNIALVSKDVEWIDTDLFDYTTWSVFRSGVPLTEDGRAIIDFYMYSVDSLEGNITVEYSNGSISSISGYPKTYYLR